MFKNKLPNNLLKGYFFLLIATLIWGAAGPIIKYTLDYFPPLTFLFLRFLIACVILLPYIIYEIQKVKVNSKDYVNFLLLGIFSQTSLALIFIGLKYTTALDNAVIGILGSILTVYSGHYFYKDKVNSKVKLGLFLASLGTLVVVLEPIFIGNNGVNVIERIFGNTLFLLYNFTWVLFVVWSKMSMGGRSSLLKKTLSFIHIKPMTKEYPPTLIISLSVFVGLFTIAPLALLEIMGFFGQMQYFNALEVNIKGIIGLLYISLFSTLVAYILYQKAIKLVKVTDQAFFGYLGPIFTVPVAYYLLGEIPNRFVVIGAIIIASGVYIAEARNGSE